ncbi:hypothetical protein VEE71_40750 [Escherichia coli]|nr:hypothetical protein VEGS02_40930 [Escherichia coli]BED15352.1 hypothetical protein VEE71_40750 [Escherichia coli]
MVSPAGAFGINILNTQVVYDGQYGDTADSANLLYLGDGATSHQVLMQNIKGAYSNGLTYRLVRATATSANNRVIISESALSAYSAVLDESTSNRISAVNITRNLNSVNLMTHITPDSSLVSSMGELNTVVRKQLSVPIQAGSSFVNLTVTYPYTGWVATPNVITELVGAAIPGQPDSTLYDVRTFSRTENGCVLRCTLSSAASGNGNLIVDIYVVGTVRGTLKAV